MPSSSAAAIPGSGSRPMARSYVASPALRQQHFTPVRRRLKAKSRQEQDPVTTTTMPQSTFKPRQRAVQWRHEDYEPPAVPVQNTLTQMDFVTLRMLQNDSDDDDLDYIYADAPEVTDSIAVPEPQPEPKIEDEVQVKREKLKKINPHTLQVRKASESRGGKRKRTMKTEEETGGADTAVEKMARLDGKAEIRVSTSSQQTSQKSPRTTSPISEKEIRPGEPSAALRKISDKEIEITSPWVPEPQKHEVTFTGSSVQLQYNSPRNPSKKGGFSFEPLAIVEGKLLERNKQRDRERNDRLEIHEKWTPLQPRSPNPRLSPHRSLKDRPMKQSTFLVDPPLPHQAGVTQRLLCRNAHVDSSPARSQATEKVQIGSPPALPRAQQVPVVHDATDGNPSRFSDPGMTIPDSEDEADTQDSRQQPPSSPALPRADRLRSQKSFSQATTVDVTQPSQRSPPTQANRSTQGLPTSSQPNDVTPQPPRSNFMPPPSSMSSDRGSHGCRDAYAITESQLLPDSLMNFELPQLPGWSQNSIE